MQTDNLSNSSTGMVFVCSLQVLVDAVEDRAGGNHKVLAKKIAESSLGKQKLYVHGYSTTV